MNYHRYVIGLLASVLVVGGCRTIQHRMARDAVRAAENASRSHSQPPDSSESDSPSGESSESNSKSADSRSNASDSDTSKSDDSSSNSDDDSTPRYVYKFSDAPPEAMAHNKQFEKAAIKSANREDYIHFKWAVIAKDWTVQRAMDAAGRAVITSKYRYAWIGGIAKTRGPKERWNKGDCIYKIMKINEEYTGGGSYGPPKFYWTDARGGAERRLKCETKKQLRAATPPAYR